MQLKKNVRFKHNILVKLFFGVFVIVNLGNTVQAQEILPSQTEFEQVRLAGKSSLTLLVENDSLLLKIEEGFYTSGLFLSGRTTLTTALQSTSYGWQIGQELYTASDINLPPAYLSAIDHPYATWLSVGVFKEQQQADGSATKLGLALGCLGPCAGGETTQTNLHRLLRQPLPQAWSTQLKQEWGAVINAEWRPARWAMQQNMDLSPKLKGRVGNIYTDASTELTWRYGQLNALPEQAASFLFARAELKLVAYNASLQGGYFNRQELAIHPNRIVPEVEVGYLFIRKDWSWNLSAVRRGSEIKELSNAKAAQNFAKVQITYSM